MKNLPMILVAVGVLLVAYWGYDYSQNNESAGVGDIKLSVSQSTSPLPGILGGLALFAGVGLMLQRKKS